MKTNPLFVDSTKGHFRLHIELHQLFLEGHQSIFLRIFEGQRMLEECRLLKKSQGKFLAQVNIRRSQGLLYQFVLIEMGKQKHAGPLKELGKKEKIIEYGPSLFVKKPPSDESLADIARRWGFR